MTATLERTRRPAFTPPPQPPSPKRRGGRKTLAPRSLACASGLILPLSASGRGLGGGVVFLPLSASGRGLGGGVASGGLVLGALRRWGWLLLVATCAIYCHGCHTGDHDDELVVYVKDR